MQLPKGFVWSAVLDGQGSAQDLEAGQMQSWKNKDGIIWVHLDYTEDEVKKWLEKESGLSLLTCEALVTDETRPRIASTDNGLLITLRAVNCNPGADPDDMVSIRLWLNENRIITMRHRRVEAINDIKKTFEKGNGPTNSGEFLVMLTERLTHRIVDTADGIDEGVDSLEDQILEQERASLRSRLSSIRRMIITLRRYIVPQREVLSRLLSEKIPWISEIDRLRLREIAERTIRIIEDLDAARDRAAIAQEELNARLSEQMNNTIYIMSIVATIFLPLGLLTGLLGINVGGIPGSETRWAFLLVCIILIIIAIIEYFIFKRKRIL